MHVSKRQNSLSVSDLGRLSLIILFMLSLGVSPTALAASPTPVPPNNSSKAAQPGAVRPKVAGNVAFSAASYSVSEGVGTAVITLTRSGSSSGAISADVLVTDVTTTAGTDYNYAAPGTLDPTFTSTVHNLVATTLALQPGSGKILTGGNLFGADTPLTSTVQRLNPDGTLDYTFSPPFLDNHLRALAVQPGDDKIVVGGDFVTASGQPHAYLARLNANGSLDTTFGNLNLDNNVESLLIQPADGKIWIGGNFTTVAGQPRAYLTRLNPDGTLDSTFNDLELDGEVSVLIFQPDGKILLGGNFSSVGGQSHNGIARLNADGTLDNSFMDTFVGDINSLAVQPGTGKIAAGGGFGNAGPGGPLHNHLAIFNSDGSLDSTFNAGTDFPVQTLVYQPDGKLLAGGYFLHAGGRDRPGLARFNVNGSLDTSFAEPATTSNIVNGSVLSLIYLTDTTKILVAGSFNGTNSLARIYSRFGVDWADGDITPKTISLTITDDNLVESNENLTLGLANLTGGATASAPTTATLTIIDNDTALSLSATPNPAGTGQPVTFTAQVSPPAATGTITFSEGNQVLGTATLTGGVANYITSSLSLGSHPVQATYSGDNTYNSSVSAVVTEVVHLCGSLDVTSAGDDGSCGTLRQAIATAATSPVSHTVMIRLSTGTPITLTSGLVLTGSVTITTSAGCGPNGTPPIIIRGSGTNSGNGLTLAGNNSLYGLWVRGFSGVQIKALAGSHTVMRCVRASQL